jgi:transaldolase
LIGPDTVDTMTLKTIESFREHGNARLSVEDDIPQARAELAALESVGISYDQVTRQLQDEGVQRFADSFHNLFACIEEKRKALKEQTLPPS